MRKEQATIYRCDICSRRYITAWGCKRHEAKCQCMDCKWYQRLLYERDTGYCEPEACTHPSREDEEMELRPPTQEDSNYPAWPCELREVVR